MKENIPPQDEGSLEQVSKTPAQELTPKPSQSLCMAKPIHHPPHPPRPPDPITPMAQEEEEAVTPTTVAHIGTATLETSEPSATEVAPIPDEEPTPISQVEIRPSLHRTASHDSLMSISGMDIHLAKRPINSTPQPLQIRGNAAYFPLKPSPARTISASQAMASVTGISAVSSKRSFSSDTQGPAGRSLQHVVGLPVSPQKITGTNPGVVAGLGQDGRTRRLGRQEVGCRTHKVHC